jgi:hypothetical protein
MKNSEFLAILRIITNKFDPILNAKNKKEIFDVL